MQKEPVKEKSKAEVVMCWNNLLVSKVTRNHSHEFYSGLYTSIRLELQRSQSRMKVSGCVAEYDSKHLESLRLVTPVLKNSRFFKKSSTR